MSDGPYRSLPMTRSWKRLAKFAQNQNFEPADICSAAVTALAKDWRAGVPPAVVDGIRNVFLAQQAGLFPEQRIEQLQALRRNTAGHGFAGLFFDCAVAVVHTGRSGEAALVEAANNALLVRASRGVRQVEEHYYREATTALANRVRGRLEDAIENTGVGALARQLLNIIPGPAPRRSMKRQGLDDGVPL